MGLPCFRGSLNNVLERYHGAAVKYGAPLDELTVVRLTGDCPLIDPALIDEVVAAYQRERVDYYSNTLTPTYPDGEDIEVFSFAALEAAYREASYDSDKEHVTLFIKNSKKFIKKNHAFAHDFSHLRFTVDNKEDLALVQPVLEALFDTNPRFGWLDVVSYLTAHPELLTVNAHIARDEGLKKSLQKDGRLL